MNTMDIVTDLEIKKAPVEGDRIAISSVDGLLGEIKSEVVPVTRVCRVGRPDLFIAYSPAVEEKLGVPIRAILKEVDAAKAARNRAQEEMTSLHLKLDNARLLTRLKYLFTRNFEA